LNCPKLNSGNFSSFCVDSSNYEEHFNTSYFLIVFLDDILQLKQIFNLLLFRIQNTAQNTTISGKKYKLNAIFNNLNLRNTSDFLLI
jgi:hypothetical protein